MQVKFVSYSKIAPTFKEYLKQEKDFELQDSPEALMIFMARVSSPQNQGNSSFEKLLQFCVEQKHWSIFEMVDATVEIETSRAIAQQILRHRSFSFQEFSQRYAKASIGFEHAEARLQDTKNRQNSIEIDDPALQDWFSESQAQVQQLSQSLYEEALSRGIAKEQARFLLPLNTRTRMYMKGSLRSWIHYVELRRANGTQKEHREIAIAIQKELSRVFPITAKALNWIE